MSSLLQKAQLYSWGAWRMLQLGRPEISLGFLGGIGDDLLCTAPIAEWLERGVSLLWFFSRYPELHARIDRRVRLVPDDPRMLRLAETLHRPMRPLSYSSYDETLDRDSPLDEHLIARMCRNAGLTGRIRLRGYVHLAEEEIAAVKRWSGVIAVQSSSMAACVPMQNKQWPAERMQTVVLRIASHSRCVQIGANSDPRLEGAEDMRGRTTLRETAALLYHARLFVGIPGFLMHLARAVECPAVIVYGGREPPELTGYPCNVNLARRPPCAPCWQRSRCDFDRVCTDAILPAEVASALESILDRPRGPLAEVTADL